MGRKKRQKGCKLQVEKKKEKEKKARTTPTHRSRCERAAPLSAHFLSLSLSLCGLSLREPRTLKLLCDWLSSAARPGNPPRWREGVREGTEMIGGTHSAPVSYSSASAGRNCAYLCMRARVRRGSACVPPRFTVRSSQANASWRVYLDSVNRSHLSSSGRTSPRTHEDARTRKSTSTYGGNYLRKHCDTHKENKMTADINGE